jgi:YebC/PmpR family DNA-binding regulatory protein
MSGHSKWSTIKHKKAAEDAKRGKIFTKLIKEISIAARDGGGDPEANPRLRTAIRNAQNANMPKDNIERAIKKGTGELPGMTYEEAHYEGYGPAGVAVFVEVLTDNKNRTTAEIRHMFTRYNGNLGETGCVAWMFDRKGLITMDAEGIDEDELMTAALEAGADDVSIEEGTVEIQTPPTELEQVKEGLEAAGLKVQVAELSMLPKNTVKLEGTNARTMLKLMEALEDQDDVQNVYANFDIPEEIMEEVSA